VSRSDQNLGGRDREKGGNADVRIRYPRGEASKGKRLKKIILKENHAEGGGGLKSGRGGTRGEKIHDIKAKEKRGMKKKPSPLSDRDERKKGKLRILSGKGEPHQK